MKLISLATMAAAVMASPKRSDMTVNYWGVNNCVCSQHDLCDAIQDQDYMNANNDAVWVIGRPSATQNLPNKAGVQMFADYASTTVQTDFAHVCAHETTSNPLCFQSYDIEVHQVMAGQLHPDAAVEIEGGKFRVKALRFGQTPKFPVSEYCGEQTITKENAGASIFDEFDSEYYLFQLNFGAIEGSGVYHIRAGTCSGHKNDKIYKPCLSDKRSPTDHCLPKAASECLLDFVDRDSGDFSPSFGLNWPNFEFGLWEFSWSFFDINFAQYNCEKDCGGVDQGVCRFNECHCKAGFDPENDCEAFDSFCTVYQKAWVPIHLGERGAEQVPGNVQVPGEGDSLDTYPYSTENDGTEWHRNDGCKQTRRIHTVTPGNKKSDTAIFGTENVINWKLAGAWEGGEYVDVFVTRVYAHEPVTSENFYYFDTYYVDTVLASDGETAGLGVDFGKVFTEAAEQGSYSGGRVHQYVVSFKFNKDTQSNEAFIDAGNKFTLMFPGCAYVKRAGEMIRVDSRDFAYAEGDTVIPGEQMPEAWCSELPSTDFQGELGSECCLYNADAGQAQTVGLLDTTDDFTFMRPNDKDGAASYFIGQSMFLKWRLNSAANAQEGGVLTFNRVGPNHPFHLNLESGATSACLRHSYDQVLLDTAGKGEDPYWGVTIPSDGAEDAQNDNLGFMEWPISCAKPTGWCPSTSQNYDWCKDSDLTIGGTMHTIKLHVSAGGESDTRESGSFNLKAMNCASEPGSFIIGGCFTENEQPTSKDGEEDVAWVPASAGWCPGLKNVLCYEDPTREHSAQYRLANDASSPMLSVAAVFVAAAAAL